MPLRAGEAMRTSALAKARPPAAIAPAANSCRFVKAQTLYEDAMASFAPPRGCNLFRRIAKLIPLDALPCEKAAAQNALLAAATFEAWRFGFETPQNYASNIASAARFFTSRKAMSFFGKSRTCAKG